jgi:hypothetical protein
VCVCVCVYLARIGIFSAPSSAITYDVYVGRYARSRERERERDGRERGKQNPAMAGARYMETNTAMYVRTVFYLLILPPCCEFVTGFSTPPGIGFLVI